MRFLRGTLHCDKSGLGPLSALTSLVDNEASSNQTLNSRDIGNGSLNPSHRGLFLHNRAPVKTSSTLYTHSQGWRLAGLEGKKQLGQ